MEMSFGFDTATKVYSELTGNLGLDAISAKKTYHFVRLMGRSASHITLEVALQTHPNLTLIGEEVQAKKQTLAQCVTAMVELILERAALGKNYGLIILVRLVGEVTGCGVLALAGLFCEHLDGVVHGGVPVVYVSVRGVCCGCWLRLPLFQALTISVVRFSGLAARHALLLLCLPFPVCYSFLFLSSPRVLSSSCLMFARSSSSSTTFWLLARSALTRSL